MPDAFMRAGFLFEKTAGTSEPKGQIGKASSTIVFLGSETNCHDRDAELGQDKPFQNKIALTRRPLRLLCRSKKELRRSILQVSRQRRPP
jgi:hypothetical protein